MYEKPDSCKACPLYKEPGPIFGVGPGSSRLALVGMNPAAEEIREGTPFTGNAGRYMNRALQSLGIPRRECFVTNIVKCRTPLDRDPTQQEAACCNHFLQDELAALPQLKVVQPLGDLSMSMLTGQQGIGKWRGYVERHNGLMYISTFHPAGVARSGGFLSWYFERDLRKAWRLAQADWNPTERLNLNPTEQEVVDYILKCKSRGVFAADIETPDKVVDDETDVYQVATVQTEIKLLGLSCASHEGLVVHPEYLPLTAPLFGDPSLTCVMFNKQFDAWHLGTHFPIRNKIFDVMIALYFLFPQARPKNLATAASLFAAGRRWKPQKKRGQVIWAPPGQTEPIYNLRDTYNTYDCYLPMLRMIRGAV